MTDRYILDDAGNPVAEPDLLRWARWFEKSERHVAQDEVGEVHISTVFLGVDHRFGEGAPLLFETMIFGGDIRRFRVPPGKFDGIIGGPPCQSWSPASPRDE